MIYLVFPKQFEMNLFLYSLYKIGYLLYIQRDNKLLNTYIIRSTFNKHQIFYSCCYIDDSDINFNFLFNKKIEEINNVHNINYDKLNFILCGTCGCDFGFNEKIGDCYFIKEAIKYDRGIFEFNEKIFLTNISFETCSKPNYIYGIKINKAVCLSGNSIMNGSTEKFKQLFKQEDSFREKNLSNEKLLFEMETYDFFRICEKYKIGNYICFRIISDSYFLEIDQLIDIINNNEIILNYQIHKNKKNRNK